MLGTKVYYVELNRTVNGWFFKFLLESKLRMSSTLLLCLKGRRKLDKTDSLTRSTKTQPTIQYSLHYSLYYIHVSTHSSPFHYKSLQRNF